MAGSSSYEFSGIFSDDAVSAGTLKQHFYRFKIMIRCFRGDLSEQRISEGYHVLLGDLGHRSTGAVAEKVQKLLKTAAIKSHRGWSGLSLIAIQPIVYVFAQADPNDSFAIKLLTESIQDRLRLLQAPLSPGSLFVFIREFLRNLPICFFRRDPTLPTGVVPKTRGEVF
jgi:hypothetical protein